MFVRPVNNRDKQTRDAAVPAMPPDADGFVPEVSEGVCALQTAGGSRLFRMRRVLLLMAAPELRSALARRLAAHLSGFQLGTVPSWAPVQERTGHDGKSLVLPINLPPWKVDGAVAKSTGAA